jgi:hypothetical protein
MDYSLLLAIEKNANLRPSLNSSNLTISDPAESRHHDDLSSSGRHDEMRRLSAKFASV